MDDRVVRLDRADAVVLLDRLHAAQNRFYAGGGDAELIEMLAPEIVWTVPGDNAIAGRYEGIEAVLGYFARRRDLASGTFRMHRRDVLSGDGDEIVALTDGSATIEGTDHHWSTVGLYRLAAEERIAACWLLTLDQAAFDAIWSVPDPDSEAHRD